MRLVPILVPSAIAIAIGTIIAAQSGWLDGGDSDPFPQSRHEIHDTTAADPMASPQEAGQETAKVGRSVGLTTPTPAAVTPPAGAAHGSGGAGLDIDGAAMPSDAAPGGSSDALQQARDEAAKAKQDVLAVTRASLESQRASEAEFEREKAELAEQIKQLQAKVADAAPGKMPEAVAQAQAKAATATAELADAHERENALRAQLTQLQAAAGTQASDKNAAERAATAERALAEAQARDKDLSDKLAALQAGAAGDRAASEKAAAEKVAATERALADAQERSKALGTEVASLKANANAAANDAGRAAAAERDLDAAQARAKALDQRVAALAGEVETGRTAMAGLSAKAEAADKLQGDLASARRDEDGLRTKLAQLQAEADSAAKARTAAATDAASLGRQLDQARHNEKDAEERLATLRTSAAESEKLAKANSEKNAEARRELADAQAHEKDIGSQVAALQTQLAAAHRDAGKAPVADGAVAKLQDDLTGARRGEATLRQENVVLQREMSALQAINKTLDEKLASLQVSADEPVRPGRADSRRHRPEDPAEHERLMRELAALKTEQMHEEVQALRNEANKIGIARHGRKNGVARNDRRVDPVRAAGDTMRSPEPHVRAGLKVPYPGVDAAPSRYDAIQRPARSDDANATIAQSRALIRSGNIDAARQLLRQRGGAAATKALADTYNPLTNTQYGVIGVDSDAEKASYLYQQAARSGR